MVLQTAVSKDGGAEQVKTRGNAQQSGDQQGQKDRQRMREKGAEKRFHLLQTRKGGEVHGEIHDL